MGDQLPAKRVTFGLAALSALGHGAAAARLMEEETAAVRLMAVTVPELLPAAMEEVRRRTVVLRSLAVAFESVADDMVNGRWG